MSKRSNNNREILIKWDQQIKNGEIQNVRDELQSWPSFKSLSETDTANFAQICRRVGLSNLGAKILYPHIQKKREFKEPYQNHFALFKEYAANLITLGVCQEGRMILSKLSESSEVTLLMAFSYIHEWEYKKASLYLKKILLELTQEDYQFWIARMNLISCYNFQGLYQEAIQLADTSLNSGMMNPLMSSYAFQQKGISHLESENYLEAEKCFQSALDASPSEKPDYQIQKWQGILKAIKEKDISHLRRLRPDAKKINDHEALRSLDYYKALIKNEKKGLTHIYFGTPHKSFISKISIHHESHNYHFNKKTSVQQQCLDLVEGTIDGEKFLSKYKNCHKLLQILLSDFYAPISEAKIHQNLYKDEMFHPFSTPQKISQQVYQLNNDFKAAGIEAFVTKERNLYRLNLPKNIFVNINKRNAQTQDIQLYHWHEKSQGKAFTAKDLAEWTGKSSRTALLMANELVEKNILLMAKKGRKHFYKFPKDSFSQKVA